MSKDPKKNPIVILENSIYELERVYISELGYLMLRFFIPDEKRYLTYNLGEYNPENNIFKNLIEENEKSREEKSNRSSERGGSDIKG